ncbi:MAG: hypothetical protein IT162_05615 [Bryobacterales bacterium]|nr:hypothetical protein [Bryobacterales bacterium]
MDPLKARVRMYRLALGDCFLLSFGPKNFDYHVLIDCGTLKGSPRTDALPAVIADISQSAGGKLDAVTVTHEHWDHLSAFAQHPDLFDKIEFGTVWMPWTEDPHDPDPVAQQLRDRFEPGLRAMGLAATSDPAVQSLLGFYGFDDGGALGAAGGKIAVNTRKARDYVLNRKPASQPFLSPGDVFEPVPGLRVYVLGPPRSRKQLARDQPRSGEAFELAVRNGVNAALGAALLQRFHATGEQDPETIDHYYPFDRRYRAQSAEEQARPELQSMLTRYREEPYRQIDDDWLSGAAELALQMDSDTNNASLVLAFELVASGKVLLFPGDAQMGNWESWHEVDFKGKITAEDLLRRTVLYKVGHHGSHNATRKPGGLESMNSRELVAMIPTDAEFALGRRPHAWHMPAAGLGAALEAKTQGRVLRADSTFPQTAAQKEAFPGRVSVTDLFVEYEIEG